VPDLAQKRREFETMIAGMAVMPGGWTGRMPRGLRSLSGGCRSRSAGHSTLGDDPMRDPFLMLDCGIRALCNDGRGNGLRYRNSQFSGTDRTPRLPHFQPRSIAPAADAVRVVRQPIAISPCGWAIPRLL